MLALRPLFLRPLFLRPLPSRPLPLGMLAVSSRAGWLRIAEVPEELQAFIAKPLVDGRVLLRSTPSALLRRGRSRPAAVRVAARSAAAAM
jgi:hypothetical protein